MLCLSINVIFYRCLLAFIYVGAIACIAYEIQWLSKPFTVTGQGSLSAYRFEMASIILILLPLLPALLYLVMISTAWFQPVDANANDFCCCTSDECCTRSGRRYMNYFALGWIALTNSVVLMMQGVRYTLHGGARLSPLCKDMSLVDPTCHTARIFLAVTAGAVTLSLCGLALVYFQKKAWALDSSPPVAELEQSPHTQQPLPSYRMDPLLLHSRRSSKTDLLRSVEVGQARPLISEPLGRIPSDY